MEKDTYILLVEDDPSLLELYQRYLKPEGYRMLTATNGEEGLAVANRMKPDLIISDIGMPGMNGYEFRESYVKSFAYRATPFIFLSGKSDPDDIIRGLEDGADDYLVKPITGKMLRVKVKTILRRRQNSQRARFEGNLLEFPALNILPFAERSRLTGSVVMKDLKGQIELRFKNGKLTRTTGLKMEDLQAFLETAKEGFFWIIADPPSFNELVPQTTGEAARPVVLQMDGQCPGLLSAIQVGSKSVDIQTEVTLHAETSVDSTAYYGGRVLMKRKTPLTISANDDAAAVIIQSQHQELEREIRERLEAFQNQRYSEPPEEAKNNEDAFMLGHEAFHKGQYRKALSYWEKAYKKDPESLFLMVHVQMAKDRIDETVKS